MHYMIEECFGLCFFRLATKKKIVAKLHGNRFENWIQRQILFQIHQCCGQCDRRWLRDRDKTLMAIDVNVGYLNHSESNNVEQFVFLA